MNTDFSNYINTKDVSFIHIGKCGGTKIEILFAPFGQRVHLGRPRKFKNYVIWIRNPFNRFISAFNQSWCLVNLDWSHIKNPNLENCIEPFCITIANRRKKKHIFPNDYAKLISFFETPNKLAEGLSSEDKNIKENAIKLMNHNTEHIFKGLAYYLDDGKFIDNNKDKILFVGRVEYMNEDIKKISKIFNKNYSEKELNEVVRKQKWLTDKKHFHLSELAIENLKLFFKKEFLVIDKLYDYNFIDKKTRDEYKKF